MKIFDLLKGVNYKGEVNNLNSNVSNLTLNSLEVTKNSVFFAVKGANQNGNDYIADAFKNGAILVISDSYSEQKNVITVKNIRKIISKLAYRFYNLSKKRLKIIGVVGTNGKTSVTYIIKNLLSNVGKKVGIIGTLGIYYNNVKINPSLTTPDSICLYKTLSDMYIDGIEYVIMEVSAHAISQYRANDILFEMLIFTNCTHDHLDYFKSFTEYSNVKKSVFNLKNTKCAVVNSDDKLGREIIFSNALPIISYGIYEPSDVFAININLSTKGTSFIINAFDNVEKVQSNLLGEFNVYNILASITACNLLGVNLHDCLQGVKIAPFVKGRFEFVESYNGADIFIDYAHTPDGLEKILKSAKSLCKNKLYVLFGCGGNRDKLKRQKMGEVAGEYADFTIITTDNPRYEEPFAIIKEIEKGVRQKTLKYITIQGRYMATCYAISKLSKGDILVIAGKGAEEYQDVLGVKSYYSDHNAVSDIIAKLDFGGEII